MNGDEENIVFRKRGSLLHTIYDGDDDWRRELRAALDDWSKQLEASERTSLARKQASCSSSKMNGDDKIVFRKRTPQLHTIYDGDDDRRREHRAALRAALDDWSKQLEASERNLARKQASCSSSQSDMYQILGLFFVFQGVVLTAVAQSNVLRCPNWLFPFLLSLVVSMAAFGAAVQKLKEMAELSDQHRLEQALYRALHSSLDALKERGIEFDIEEGQPRLMGHYTEEEIKGKGSVANFYSIISPFWSVWVWSYAGAVILLLLVFSALTLIAVPQILCHPGAAE